MKNSILLNCVLPYRYKYILINKIIYSRLHFSGGGRFGRALASVSSEAISDNAPSDRVESDQRLPPKAYDHGGKEGEVEGKNQDHDL